MDILHGLTLCSVDEFKTLFEHKLQQSKALSLEENKHLSQAELLSEVRVLLSTAAQYYDSLNMSDKWNLPRNQCVNVFGTPNNLQCWNCGKKGHGLNDCSEPRNEKRIAENREKWEASGGKSKSKKGKKNRSSGGSTNYEHEKWTPPKSGESGVRHIDGSVANKRFAC